MQAPPNTKDIVKKLPVVKESDPVVKPLELLSKHGVAILVNAQDQPLGILTWCDDPQQMKETIVRLKSEGRENASALYQAMQHYGPDFVYRVRESDPLAHVAQTILDREVRTGITVVDRKGRYSGYAFASDVSAIFKASVEQRERQLKSEEKRLIQRYPEAASQIRGWSSGSEEAAQ